MDYQLTPLEQDVKDLYHSLSVIRPDQIELLEIAARLNIWISLGRFSSKAKSYKGFYSIDIDSRISESEQWEVFGHELCHILRHGGNQLWMPKEFRDFQEVKANNFALHFCVPTFMILDSGLPHTWNEAILYVMETFNVTEPFARKRLEHFHKQVIGFEFYNAIENHLKYQIPRNN
jgi:Zn-dependent peptidase ImmA (M78 family)